jgi:hypothetical protein
MSLVAVTMAVPVKPEKRCPRCGMTKPAEAFGWDGRRERLRTYCRPCFRKVWREWYDREPNRRKHLAQNAVRRRRLRQRNKQLFRDLKSRPCADCGNEYPSYVMDFDHVGEKLEAVSRMVPSYALKRLQSEIAKCDVVCANCHRIRTFQRLASNGMASMIPPRLGASPQSRLPGMG